MLTETNDYDKLCREFRWDIPARFNMVTACCDRHADGSGRGALKGKYAGQMDFGKASGLVKAALTG